VAKFLVKVPAGWTAAKYAYEEARHGNPYPLAARLMIALQASNKPLSDDELRFIRDTLEASAGKETNALLRDLELQLIAQQVDGLIDEDGKSPKDAVDAVKRDRRRSVRHIRTALKAYGKSRRYRG
jgi:hypothetical protein